MMRNKVQVDAHVSSTLKELKSKYDKLLRGYKFAKMYFDIKEFDKAEEYLQGYLTVKANYAPAYNLLGQIYESKGKDYITTADAYKKSFEIDNGQKDILRKICELYADNSISPDEAKFWGEKAEKHFPNLDAVIKLKLKAQDMQGNNSSNNNNAAKLIEYYEAESARYPKDLTRKVQLLKLFLSVQRIEDAYAHVIEAETQEMFNSFEWYKCAIEVLLEFKRCKMNEKLSSEFYEFFMLALCLHTSFTVGQSQHISGAVHALWSMDEELGIIKKEIDDTELMKALYSELKAQFLFLCGTLILNKVQKENLSWRTLSDPSFACFLASISKAPLDIKDSWCVGASEIQKKIYRRWHSQSCYRSSQIGHMLKKKYETDSCGSKWMRRIQEEYCHNVGKFRICQVVYSDTQTKESLEKSSLYNALLSKAIPDIPSNSQLSEWDGVVQMSNPGNLELLVWICLHYYDNTEEVQCDYPFALFTHLPFGCEKIESSEPSTLCQLDVQTFLMAVVKCSALKHAENMKLQDPHHPFLLPSSINEVFCTKPQLQWWAAISQHDSLVLRKGLEVVRLIGAHGIHVKLLTHLAKTWAVKLEDHKIRLDSTLEFSENDSFIEGQAFHFWNNALNIIEKQLNKQIVPLPKVCLFESRNFGIPSCEDLEKLLQEGKLFLSFHLKKNNNFTEALAILKSIKCSAAFCEMAEIYKDMAEENGNPCDQRTLLLKAKKALEDGLKLNNDPSEFEKMKLDLNDVNFKLLDIQSVNECAEFDDCSSFGGTKLSCTPQRTPNNFKPSLMTSSTPFARKIRSPLELEGTGLAYVMHYVDQKISSVNDENKKLYEKIVMLENKVSLLETQKLMWMSMPFHPLIPQTHQFYPGNAPFRNPSESEVSNRMSHPMLDKYNPVIHPGFNHFQQNVMLPGYNSHPIQNLRPNLITHHETYKSCQPPSGEAPVNFVSPSEIDDVESSDYNILLPSMLPSIDNRFFPRQVPSSCGIQDFSATTPRFSIPSVQTATPTFANTSAQKTHNTYSQSAQNASSHSVASNSSLAKLLLTSPTPSMPISNDATDKLCKDQNKPILTSPPKENFDKVKFSPENKMVLGGLTFMSTPVVKNTEETKKSDVKVTEKEKTTTENPFSNFSFGNVSSATKSPFTFSLMSSSAPNDGKTKPEIEEHAGDEELVEDFEPTGEFKPLVHLPIVNVVTGEENCKKLFGERGKLYRMDFETKQWKERGVGEIKILESNANKKARILMRRDQVFKVCANHFITSEMKLKSMDTSENSYCWIAMDYAEEEMRKEHFCIKFKTKDIANAFKECFEMCQTNIKEINQINDSQFDKLPEILNSLEKIPLATKTLPLSLSDQFKARGGEWSCTSCYVSNPISSTACLACETPKTGCEKTDKSRPLVESQVMIGNQGGFQFGQIFSKGFGIATLNVPMATSNIVDAALQNNRFLSVPKGASGMSLSDQFKAKEGEWSCSACYVRNPASSFACLACETPKPGYESIAKAKIHTESQVTFGSHGGFQFEPISSASFGNIFSGLSDISKPSVANAFTGNAKPPVTNDNVLATVSGPKLVMNSPFGSSSNSGFSFTFPISSIAQESCSKAFPGNGIKLTGFFVNPDKIPTSLDKPSSIFSKTSTTENIEASNVSDSNSNVANDTKIAQGALPVEDELYNNVDGEDAHIHFEPLVKLPEHFEVRTLEEEETVLYSENAKIFRFNNNEWKEKGSGIVKLLRNEENGKVRVLMRRDKIHKICCNHYITADMQLRPLMNSKKALVWYAHDYNDGDQTLQQLCIKFKTEENTMEFQKHFEGVVNDLKTSNEASVYSTDDCVITHVEEPSEKHVIEATRLMLPKTFYNYLNFPPCKGCIGCKDDEFDFSETGRTETLKNEQELFAFTAVQGEPAVTSDSDQSNPLCLNKPGMFTFASLTNSMKSEMNGTPLPPFTFTIKNDVTPPSIEAKVKEADRKITYNNLSDFDDENDSLKMFPNFSPHDRIHQHETLANITTNPIFGSLTTNINSIGSTKDFKSTIGENVQNLSSSTPVFGSISKTLDFASLSSNSATFKSDSKFSWKGAGEKLFTASTPEKVQTSNIEVGKEDEGAEVETDIHFEPVVHLPEVEVMTGEENEDEVFKQRSVLYRFDGQWKERGVGDMKILKQKDTATFRLLMRRDQIHKVVCNHLLTTDMKFNFMESSEKALCWYANDFSEEQKVEQFALKFKTVELAKEFKRVVEECQNRMKTDKS